jgi:hypothetical protein
MDFLVWLHLVGAAIWLGGLVTLAVATFAALRALPREQFRLFIRSTGRAFGAVAGAALVLTGVTGLLLAAAHHWPRLAVDKIGLTVFVALAAVGHVGFGMRTSSRASVLVSRVLAVLLFLATLGLFWIGVRLA